MTEDSKAFLNPHQQRRLRGTCQYVGNTLSDTEGILNSAATKSAFQKYIPDLQPAERRVIEDCVGRIRAHVVRVLKGQGIEPEPPSIPATRAVHDLERLRGLELDRAEAMTDAMSTEERVHIA